MHNYTILIKKFNNHFVALCIELNISAQGDTLVEARQELAKAIQLYQDYSSQTNIHSAPLDMATLREFLTADEQETQSVEVDQKFKFLETFATTIPHANPMPA